MYLMLVTAPLLLVLCRMLTERDGSMNLGFIWKSIV
jgi:hypothetical protein